MKKGFTLIELLVVVAILAILMGAVIVAINPLRQISQANNTNRLAGATTILNAIYQNIINYGGTWTCVNGNIPTTTATYMGTAGGEYDICPCLVTSTPSFLGEMPIDPTAGVKATTPGTCIGYSTGFRILMNASTTKITIDAPSAQLGEVISISR